MPDPVVAQLVYLVAVAAVLGACSRWLRPIRWWVALALVLLPYVLTGAAAVAGHVYGPVDLVFAAHPWREAAQGLGVGRVRNGLQVDVIAQMIPWRAAVRDAWFAREWPLWNPSILGGDPLAGSAQSAPYSPLTLVGLLVSLPFTLNLSAQLTLFFAASGVWLLLRDLGTRPLPALVGGAGFALSSFLTMWLLVPLGETAALQPWVLLGVRRGCRRPGTRSGVLLGLVLLDVLLAGHPETAVQVVAVGGVWGLGELWLLGWGRRLKALATCAAAGLSALALAAIFILPVVDTIGQSFESSFRRKHYARSPERSVSLVEALDRGRTNLVPFVYGLPHCPGEQLPWPKFFLPVSNAYVGSALLAPALLGLAWGRQRLRWLLAGLGLLGAAVGSKAPGVSDLLAALPVFSIAHNERFVLVGALAVAMLAAIGLDAVIRRRGRGVVLTRASLVVALVLWAMAAWPWVGMWHGGLSVSFLRLHTLLLVVPPLSVALAALTLDRSPRLTAVVLGILLVQRLGEVGGVFPHLPPAAFYPRVAPLDALPPDDPPYRVVGHAYCFTPAASALYGLEDVRGYQAVNLPRRMVTDRLWSAHMPIWFNRVDDLRAPFLGFLGVRFAIAAPAASPPPGWRVAAAAPTGTLLEREAPVGIATVPGQVVVGLSGEPLVRALAEARDLGAVGFVELDGTSSGAEPEVQANGPGTVRVRRLGAGHLELEVAMERPGWVLVAESGWRGWSARAGGRPVPLVPANGAYLALQAPAGSSRVELEFCPASFRLGRAVSAATLTLLAGAALTSTLRRRR